MKKAPFCPISALYVNFNLRNTQCVSVVEIVVRLEIEQN